MPEDEARKRPRERGVDPESKPEKAGDDRSAVPPAARPAARFRKRLLRTLAPRQIPGEVVLSQPPAKADLPPELEHLADAGWVDARVEDGWACLDPEGTRYAAPDGRAFTVRESGESVQERIDLRVGGDSLRNLGTLKVEAQVAMEEDRPELGEVLGSAMGFGTFARAVPPPADRSNLCTEIGYRVFSGARRRTRVAHRRVAFLHLVAEDNGEHRHVRLYGPWDVDRERSGEEDVLYLRQERTADTVCPGVEHVDLVFAGFEILEEWLENPGLVVATDHAPKFDRSTSTKKDVRDGEAVDPSDAPSIPSVNPVGEKPRCKKHRGKTVNVMDNGHSQTELNRAGSGVPGMINVSSVNDTINKLIDAVDLEECECIEELNFFGHGAAGAQSVGAGESWDSDRELKSANIESFGEHVKCLMCPDAVVNFYGCNVGRGSSGESFLQEVADALCATVNAWTGTVMYRWSYDKDGNVEDFRAEPQGTKVTRTPSD